VKEKILRAKSFFLIDQGTLVFRGSFNSLALDLMIHDLQQYPRHVDKLRALTAHITEDLWAIFTVVDRLWRTQQAAIRNEFEETLWRSYSALDINFFHIQVRSVMDTLATLISETADKRGQLPASFADLVSKLNRHSSRLDPRIVSILENSTWFYATRDVRDKIVHYNAKTLIFGEPCDGILFQVFSKKFSPLIHDPRLMHNENTVIFDRYATVVIANLICLIEDVFDVLYLRYGLEKRVGSYVSSLGFGIFYSWLNSAESWL
jgi:hypothetical protein